MNKSGAAFLVPHIVDTLVRTFEEIAFVDVMPVNNGTEITSLENVLVLDIMKPFQGSLYLFISDQLKLHIAENIFGQDASTLNVRDLDDSLLETLNILTGQFLTRAYPPGTEIRIEFPRMLMDSGGIDTRMGIMLFFEAEGYPMQAFLEVGADD